MAFLIGDGGAGNQPQASNNEDLLDKLVNFLTGVTGSIPTSERWTVLKSVNSQPLPRTQEVYLVGPGLSASDNIFVNLRTYEDPNFGYYSLEIRGAIGFDASLSFETQPGSSSSYYTPLNNVAFNYWFVASGRRFIVVAEVQSTWQHMYGGFYLPFSTPAEFPYPMFIGAQTNSGGVNYTTTTFQSSAYWDPADSATIIHRDNTWLPVKNLNPSATSRTFNTSNISLKAQVYPYYTLTETLLANIDGSYSMLPIYMDSSYSGGNTYGELEGIYAISGAGQLTGNVISISGVDYLVTANSNRLQMSSFAALRLQ